MSEKPNCLSCGGIKGIKRTYERVAVEDYVLPLEFRDGNALPRLSYGRKRQTNKAA